MPLEAKNIYFRYDRKQPWILEDCSVRVDRGISNCADVFRFLPQAVTARQHLPCCYQVI